MVTKTGATIEARRLQNLYGVSATNKAAFDYFAARKKNSTATTVERLQQVLRLEGHDVSRRDIIELFKALEQAGCGEFMFGRKGHSSRFEWGVSLMSVGLVAAGEDQAVDPLSDADKAAAEVEDDTSPRINHRYILRPGEEVVIPLPADLTPVEAGRVADFVRTLSFQR